jgi:hypothetical protein
MKQKSWEIPDHQPTGVERVVSCGRGPRQVMRGHTGIMFICAHLILRRKEQSLLSGRSKPNILPISRCGLSSLCPSPAAGARPPGRGVGTPAVHPARASHGAPAMPPRALAPGRRRSAPQRRSCDAGRDTAAVRAPVRLAMRRIWAVPRVSVRVIACRIAGQ